MALYRVSGNLYTVSFESNLGDVMVRTLRLPSLSSGYSHGADYATNKSGGGV